ncbi:hypothetical protein BHL93_08310 [Limosilactobacillus reuteri]|nr:hypothetical protein BHL90_08760 [Limosilactobacillus reuteri]OTA58522.1 hypothetical protein BHL93_08310 [Limosilactobacillus reuteri]
MGFSVHLNVQLKFYNLPIINPIYRYPYFQLSVFKKLIKYCKIIINFVVIFDAIKDWALFTFGRVI